MVSDHFDGRMGHLNQRDVTMVCLSRAPHQKINAYTRRIGWASHRSRRQAMTSTTTSASRSRMTRRANGAEYNFQWCDDPGDEGRRLSSFALEGGVVHHHIYSTYEPRDRRL